MGGALAMASAAAVSEIDASAPFYGIPSSELADVTKIKVPLQCHFAEKDDVSDFLVQCWFLYSCYRPNVCGI